MRRVLKATSAASAALQAFAYRAREEVAEIRDAAEVGPDTLRLLEAESLRNNEALAWRIRQILGPRNDDTRAVIDDLCEELDRQPGPIALYDGYRVLQALDDKARARTSPKNVSDVLDAVVRIMRERERRIEAEEREENRRRVRIRRRIEEHQEAKRGH